jgi:hypothetical protein
VTDAERKIMDHACQVAREAMAGGPLIPRMSVPDGSRLRCSPDDVDMLRERFVPGTPIEVDPTLAVGQVFMDVALTPVAEHIDCTIGFVNERKDGG